MEDGVGKLVRQRRRFELTSHKHGQRLKIARRDGVTRISEGAQMYKKATAIQSSQALQKSHLCHKEKIKYKSAVGSETTNNGIKNHPTQPGRLEALRARMSF
jgi:hypothetical protein